MEKGAHLSTSVLSGDGGGPQLFKALLLVMNYFVISTVMRFIFNNCNNYFIKKRSHALRLSLPGWKEFSLSALYYPGAPSVGCPAEITLGVNNVCFRSKQSYLQRPADSGRCIKADTNALCLIKSLRGNSSKALAFNERQSALIHQQKSGSETSNFGFLGVIYSLGAHICYQPRTSPTSWRGAVP